jgi:hypothetical protein
MELKTFDHIGYNCGHNTIFTPRFVKSDVVPLLSWYQDCVSFILVEQLQPKRSNCNVTIKVFMLVWQFLFLSQIETANALPMSCLNLFQGIEGSIPSETSSSQNVKYSPIQWLPEPPPGSFEVRYLVYDPTTGSQHEARRIETTLAEIEGLKSAGLDSLRPRVSSGTYTYSVPFFDPVGNFKRGPTIERPYYSTQGISRVQLSFDTAQPFYVSWLTNPTHAKNLIEPRFIQNEPNQSQAQNSTEPMVSSVVYLKYPEAPTNGMVSERMHSPILSDVKLYPIGSDSENSLTLRIREHKTENSILQIIDPIVSSLISTNQLGTLFPGIYQILLSKIDPKFHIDLFRLIQSMSKSYLPYGFNAFERLLSVHNIGLTQLHHMQKQLLKEGQKKQRAHIQEILDFIIPLYRERRGWDEKKVQDFSENAFKTANSTQYIVIRDRKGKIRAVLGLTSVEYGKVRFYDKKSNSIVELTGSYGSALLVRQGKNLIDKDRIPVPEIWRSQVEMLPVETEGFQIPYPGVLERTQLSPEETELRLKHDTFLKGLGYDADWTKPVEFYTGRKSEAVKFGVDKNLENFGLSNVEVLTQMLSAVFPSEMSKEFNKKGQILVTYNTADGVRMYGRLGFKRIPGAEPIVLGGQNWYALYASPESVLEAIQKIQYEKSDEAQKILDFLSATYSEMQ